MRPPNTIEWRGRSLAMVAAVALGLAGGGASAADLQPPPQAQALSSTWIATVGVMGFIGPNYDGAKKYGVSAFPSLSFRRAGEPIPLSAPDDSLDVALFENPWFSIGPVLALRTGRDRRAARQLSGVDEYRWTLEPGAYVEIWPIPDLLRTRVEIRHGLRSDSGLVADLSADLFHRYGAFTFSAGPRMKFADSREMRTEFGVSHAVAARGFLPRFTPSGGVKSAGYALSASYDWSDKIRTTIFHRYDRLAGDAAASPITKRFGSANQFTFGVGASYSFDTGKL